MIVLGFDTATQATAVGLRLADGTTLHARDDPAAGAHPGHATRLLAIAGELLAQAGLSWGELERVAVGVGPGRFTGLRVGIATARGLVQSLGVPLVGVSSLRALAFAAARAAGETPPSATIAVIDARRGEAFAAAYSAAADFAALARTPMLVEPDGASNTTATEHATSGEIEFRRALRPQELREIVELAEREGAPRGQRWRAVGDGALLYEQALADGGVELLARESPLHLIDGGAVCELGALASIASGGGLPETVLPDYRRSPDAALARQVAPAAAPPPAAAAGIGP